MNGNYYKTPMYIEESTKEKSNIIKNESIPEQNSIEDILKNNKGKKVALYFTFPNSNDYKDKIFTGVIEGSAEDHVTIREANSGKWYVVPIKYLNYIEFPDKINYKVALKL